VDVNHKEKSPVVITVRFLAFCLMYFTDSDMSSSVYDSKEMIEVVFRTCHTSSPVELQLHEG